MGEQRQPPCWPRAPNTSNKATISTQLLTLVRLARCSPSSPLGQMTESEVSIKAAIAVLEERALNLANWAIGFTSVLPNAKMELSSPLTEEIAELEELTVEFKEGLSEQTKRKLSAGSPSAKLA